MKKVEYKSILIVEDDSALREELCAYFSATNTVTACGTLKSALETIDKENFDVVLLDVILPDGSGLKLLERAGDMPVIILSDLGSDGNVLEGFSAGAADYVVKPSSPQIIEARMSLRLLPRVNAQISSYGLVLDLAKRTAVYNKRQLDLTSSEFNILMFLMQNAGNFFTAAEIYEQVWKMPYLNTTTIKAHLSNLRKKMLGASKDCAELILTEFGKGYAFTGDNNE